MLGHNIFIWNVRGLNSQAHRDVVREFLLQERASVACLVETKIDVLLVACVLSRTASGVQELYLKVIREADVWVHAGFKTLSAVYPLWSQNFVVM